MMDRCPTCKRLTKRARRKEPTRVGGKTRAEERAARKETARRQMAELREQVMERARGRCEFCGSSMPLQMHHLEGGSGRRAQKQSLSNVCGVCVRCHRAYHAAPYEFALVIEDWAAEHGYPLPASIRRAAP